MDVLKFIIDAKVVQKGTRRPKEQVDGKVENKAKRVHKCLSLFGALGFSRPTFYSKVRGVIYTIDGALSFPHDLWSFRLWTEDIRP